MSDLFTQYKTYEPLKFKYQFNYDGSIVQPNIYLMNKQLKKICQLISVDSLKIIISFNDANECSFVVHKSMNDEVVPYWEQIKDLSIVLIEGFGLFELSVPLDETDILKKNVTGKSLQEEELSQINVTFEVNTENDMTNNGDMTSTDYDENFPVVLYRILDTSYYDFSDVKYDNYTYEQKIEVLRNSSLMHKLLLECPHYKIGHVDGSIIGCVGKFSFQDTAITDALNTIAQEFGCVFIFDPYSRTINAFDVRDHCTNEITKNGETSICYGRHILNGVCQDCFSDEHIEKGFGIDTSFYVDTENLAQEITLNGNKDNIKNCMKITGGDDDITDMIAQRVIGGTNYIYEFNPDTINNEFSEELRNKYLEYVTQVSDTTLQKHYNDLWDTSNKLQDDKMYWESRRMPNTINSSATTAQDVYDHIKSNIKYVVLGSKYTTLKSLSSDILNYAKLLLPETYSVEFVKDENLKDMTSCTGNTPITSWSGNIFVYKDDSINAKGKYTDCYPPEDRKANSSYTWVISDIRDGYTTVNITENGGTYSYNYYDYLKKQLDIRMANSMKRGLPKYDSDYTSSVDTSDSNYYKNYFAGYCKSCGSHNVYQGKCHDCGSTHIVDGYGVNRLKSFRDVYAQATLMIENLNSQITNNDKKFYYIIDKNGTVSNKTIHESLIEKFSIFKDYCEDLIYKYTYGDGTDHPYLESKDGDYSRKSIESQYQDVQSQVRDINTKYNLKNYLGNELYNELVSYRREQVYNNSNFSSDTIDIDYYNSEVMDRIEELIVDAKAELAKACIPRYSLTTSMANPMSLSEYADFYNCFTIGNYIRLRVDNQMVKLRLIEVSFDFDNIQEIDVAFSDAMVGNAVIEDYNTIMKQAQSLATTVPVLTQQTTHNNERIGAISELMADGLNTTNTMIKNADNQTGILDEFGYLGRKLNTDTGNYDDRQIRIINNCIAFTNDNWNHIKSAFGEIYYNNEWRYGVITDAIIGKMLIGENLHIENRSGTYSMTDTGFSITKNDNRIILDARTPMLSISNGTANSITFNADEGSFKIRKGNDTALSYTPSDGLYIKGNGSFSGNIYADNGYFKGDITGASGTFSGTLSSATIIGGTITGGAIAGGTIIGTNINNGNGTFVVDTDGNVTASHISGDSLKICARNEGHGVGKINIDSSGVAIDGNVVILNGDNIEINGSICTDVSINANLYVGSKNYKQDIYINGESVTETFQQAGAMILAVYGEVNKAKKTTFNSSDTTVEYTSSGNIAINNCAKINDTGDGNIATVGFLERRLSEVASSLRSYVDSKVASSGGGK